ncbi:hypothetical protein [Parasitella parasitica]|uniref:Uncharacterized protein n=1 Tax=Parasitella parasitica TaxID=35722 RepID=A0A0B7N4P1_9FUNG|nr:hypothetical protein [Parasitella parasitica]
MSVLENDICRMGRGNSDTMTNCFLDILPKQFIHVMAGFVNDSVYHLSALPRSFNLEERNFQRKVKAHILADVEPESALMVNFAPETSSSREFHLGIALVDGKCHFGKPTFTAFHHVEQRRRRHGCLHANLNVSSSTSNISSSIPSSSSTNLFSCTSANPTSSATLRSTDVNGIPIYKMSRNIKIVKQLYEKWTLDLNGDWPVQQLEEERHVVGAVNDLVADLHLSVEDAIEKLQVAMTKRELALGGLGTFDILET